MRLSGQFRLRGTGPERDTSDCIPQNYFVLRTTPRMGCEPRCPAAALLPPAGIVNISVTLE